MNIKVSQTPYIYKNYNYKSQNNVIYNSVACDTFTRTNTNNQTSFKGLFSSFFTPQPAITYTDDDINASDFAKSISKGLKEVMDVDIPPSHFQCVMSPKEVKAILPKLMQSTQKATDEQFKGTYANIEEGIYCADLDYQTTYTKNGKENIFDMLDRVSEYAEIYHKKTGKDFIFAVTDRDTVQSSQHVLRLIGEEPERFKHVKFIPGMKISFAHEAPQKIKKNRDGSIKPGSDYANSDMLVYGINPFSENLMNYVAETKNSRKQMIMDFINDVYNLYPEFVYRAIEFAEQNRLLFKKSYGVPDLYWRVREYTETKGDLAMKSKELTPEEVLTDAYLIMAGAFDVMVGAEEERNNEAGSNIVNNEDELNMKIEEVFRKYATHKVETTQKIVSSAENVYEDMIARLSKEKQKPVLAIAAPYYFTHYFEPKRYDEQNRIEFKGVVDAFKDMKAKSNGMLFAFETVAPSYDLDKILTQETIDHFNNYISENTDLYQVGGSFAKVKIPY